MKVSDDMNKINAIKTLEHHYAYLRQSWKPYPDQKALDAIGMAVSALENRYRRNQEKQMTIMEYLKRHIIFSVRNAAMHI